MTVKGKAPIGALPFLSLKNKVLGKNYMVSLIFVGDRRSKTLNQKYRGKTYVPNVLAFPLSKTSGEIFITLSRIKKEAPVYGMREKEFLTFLFIHALLHLKGYGHGSKMEREEEKIMKQLPSSRK